MNDHQSKHNKQNYDESVFLIQLPAIAFLIICFVVGFLVCMIPSHTTSYSPSRVVTPSKVSHFAKASEPKITESKSKNDTIHDAQSIMKGTDCAACHKENDTAVGPSFANIAFRYKGDSNAISKLSAKIISGGSGNWGTIQMAAHPNLSDADAKILVAYILKVKGGVKVPPFEQVVAIPEAPGKAIHAQYDCKVCHDIDKKVIGPTYKEISKRYRGNNAALKTLIEKVKLGGQGTWGEVPMTAHQYMKDQELLDVIKWILDQ